MSSIRLWILFGVAVLLAACSGSDLLVDPTGFRDAQLVRGGIRVTLTVTPSVFERPGTAVATLTYENLGPETVALTSSYGCVSFASVYRGEERIPFPSTQYGCTAAFSSRDLEPGVPLTVQWPLVAGGENGIDVPSGIYRFVARLNTHPEDLSRTFLIR